jgi:hypothetical protein
MSTQNIFDLVDTWNSAGTTFVAIRMNATDTASAAGSLLIDLQVGGVSQFQVRKNGSTGVGIGNNAPTTYFHIGQSAAGNIGPVLMLSNTAEAAGDSCGIFGSTALGNALPYRSGVLFWPGVAGRMTMHVGTNATATAGRVMLLNSSSGQSRVSVGSANDNSDTATFNTVNGTTATNQHIYRSFTDTSNYSRFALDWSSSTAVLATEGAGTGARGNIAFGTAALATSATVGYVMIPSSAGAPTGVPADIPTGQVALHYDTVNNKIYVYNGGWVSTAALT